MSERYSQEFLLNGKTNFLFGYDTVANIALA